MTPKEINEIERIYQKHADTEAGQRILRLVGHCRALQAMLDARSKPPKKGKERADG